MGIYVWENKNYISEEQFDQLKNKCIVVSIKKTVSLRLVKKKTQMAINGYRKTNRVKGRKKC